MLQLLGCWLLLTLVAMIGTTFSFTAAIVSWLIIVAVTIVIGHEIWNISQAQQKVLVSKHGVSVLWGFARLLAWNPNVGVLILKNKQLYEKDDDLTDGGGLRLIYPNLGEELALRVPLEVQTLNITDEKVLTREYLGVTIRGTMKWRINEIEKFYLFVSRELRSTSDASDGVSQTSVNGKKSDESDWQSQTDSLLTAAVEWLRLIFEEQTRRVVSHVSSGLLLAERVSSEISELKDSFLQSRIIAGPQSTSKEWQGAADGLAENIRQAVIDGVAKYGIAVEAVSLQEIRLPQEIVDQCVEACKTAYLPVLAQRKALSKRAELATEVELLGREAVVTERIVGAAPKFTLTDFLERLVAKGVQPGVAIDQAAVTAKTVSAIATAVEKADAVEDKENSKASGSQ